MFSSVTGLQLFINKQMENLGFNNSIIISGGSSQYSGRRRRYFSMKRKQKQISYLDFVELNRKIPHKSAYGFIQSWRKINHNNHKKWIRLCCTTNDYFKTKTYPLFKGRYFNNFEMKKSAKVCIVGMNFVNKYFNNNSEVLGKFVFLGKYSYRIIGILKNDVLASGSGFNFNSWERRNDLKSVYIPLKTGYKYLRNSTSIDYIYIQSKDELSLKSMITQVKQFFLARHNMAHDISINNIGSEMVKITNQLHDVMKKWNITLLSIASISLLVGGIGLFSTLLISISERMNEIGIRKTVGSTDREIFLYFVNEAIVLAMIAAVLGILFSEGLLSLASVLAKFKFSISIKGVFFGLGFSFLIGLISGIYPAYKAAKINPIEAIYYYE
jgi:putative ABC transport system permease protein